MLIGVLLVALPCVVGREFVQAQTCAPRDALQHSHRGRLRTCLKAGNRSLRNTDLGAELGLGESIPLSPFNESSHMTGEDIGFTYKNNIGISDLRRGDNVRMSRAPQRSFFERAMEGLIEKYPKETARQARLAQLAGVKQPTVNDWKEGAPAIDTGIRLAKALGLCVEWLYTERGPKRPGVANTDGDQYLSPILEAWPELDDELKRQIAKYADFVRDDKKPD